MTAPTCDYRLEIVTIIELTREDLLEQLLEMETSRGSESAAISVMLRTTGSAKTVDEKPDGSGRISTFYYLHPLKGQIDVT